jgi:hypothetical protein
MAKFLVLYRAPVSAAEQMATSTPEQAQAGIDAWMAWAARAGEAIVDLGSPLVPAQGAQHADGGDLIGGYSILQAESAAALAAVLEGHPHSAMGGTIEVHEFLPMPGM